MKKLKTNYNYTKKNCITKISMSVTDCFVIEHFIIIGCLLLLLSNAKRFDIVSKMMKMPFSTYTYTYTYIL